MTEISSTEFDLSENMFLCDAGYPGLVKVIQETPYMGPRGLALVQVEDSSGDQLLVCPSKLIPIKYSYHGWGTA